MGNFKHYTMVAFRSLKKHKVSSLFSLLGLSAAFALSIIVSLTTWDALMSDSHWKDADNIYRLHRGKVNKEGRPVAYRSPNGLSEDIKNFSPDILHVSAPSFLSVEVKIENKYQRLSGFKVDEEFFNIFDYEILSGDFQGVFGTPSGIALSDTKAVELFGEEDPIGKNVELLVRGKIKLFTIECIFKKLSKGSNLRYIDVFIAYPEDSSKEYSAWTYILKKKGAKLEGFLERIAKIVEEKYPPKQWEKEAYFVKDPLKGAAFHGFFSSYFKNRQIGLMISASMMLLVALLNYMALTTAVTATRGKDVALRKILGASKRKLSFQYIIESLILVSLSYGVALGLAVLFAGQIGAIIGDEFIVLSVDKMPQLLVGWSVALAAGLITSAYPIWSMVHGKASSMLANFQRSLIGGGTKLRSLLLVVQTACGLGLVFGAGVIYMQTNLAEYADMGFEKDGLLYITATESSRPMKNALERIDGVKEISVSSTSPPLIWNLWTKKIVHPSTADTVEVKYGKIGDNFMQTLGVRLLAGRIPPAIEVREKDDEPLPEQRIMVNELFVEEFFPNSTNVGVLGRCVTFIKSEDKKEDTCYKITAVMANYYQDGKEQTLSATMFVPERSKNELHIIVRYDPAIEKQLLPKLQVVWDEFFPFRDFDYDFVDDLNERDFRVQRATASLLLFTAIGSLILTVAGLYAMARFVVARRAREIAIRRVLGANSIDIVKLISIQLAKPIILGAVIGLPIGWYYAMDWLMAYSVRIEPEPWHAVLLGVFGVLFFLATATGEILRAVRIRPAEALHYE